MGRRVRSEAVLSLGSLWDFALVMIAKHSHWSSLSNARVVILDVVYSLPRGSDVHYG